jgi:hypothetical protein
MMRSNNRVIAPDRAVIARAHIGQHLGLARRLINRLPAEPFHWPISRAQPVRSFRSATTVDRSRRSATQRRDVVHASLPAVRANPGTRRRIAAGRRPPRYLHAAPPTTAASANAHTSYMLRLRDAKRAIGIAVTAEYAPQRTRRQGDQGRAPVTPIVRSRENPRPRRAASRSGIRSSSTDKENLTIPRAASAAPHRGGLLDGQVEQQHSVDAHLRRPGDGASVRSAARGLTW